MMTEENVPIKTARPGKRRRGFLNLLLIIGIIAAIALFIWAEAKRRSISQELVQTSQQLEEIKRSTSRSGQEVAAEVLAKVRAHMDVPSEPEPTVATIVDVDKLRQSSDFYLRAENGHHLIITSNRAILYDPTRDIIVDVVPVRLDAAQGTVQPSVAPPNSDSALPPAAPASVEPQISPAPNLFGPR
jgi:hypothetical protein